MTVTLGSVLAIRHHFCLFSGQRNNLHGRNAFVRVRSTDDIHSLLVCTAIQRSTVDKQQPHSRLKKENMTNVHYV